MDSVEIVGCIPARPLSRQLHVGLRDKLDKHLRAAVEKLSQQHNEALGLIDDFCIERATIREAADIEGPSLPGTMPSSPEVPTKSIESQSLTAPQSHKNKISMTSVVDEDMFYQRSPSAVTVKTSKASGENPVKLAPPSGCPRSLTIRSMDSHYTDFGSHRKTVDFEEALSEAQHFMADSVSAERSLQRRKSLVASAQMAVEKSSRISSDRPSPSINAKHAVFVDADAMKERVKQSIMKPEYDVKNYYFQEGHFQFIARHCIFEYLTLAVIAANAVWIAIDTDHNGGDSLLDAQTVFVVGENFFCVYFSLELLIRFMAFEEKKNCLRDAWFVFDSILVVMMVMETWVMTAILLLTQTGGSSGLGNTSILRLVRLLRLSRMARMARLLRAMPELMILVKGIVAATRSVFFTLCLLVILIYVFGIAFVQLTADMDSNVHDDYFKKVPRAMHSLLLHLVLPDEAALILEVGEDSWVLAALLLIFVLLSTLTILNMLVGVLVEVVSVVSEVEKEQMMVSFVKTELLSLLNDVDGNMKISKTEFEQLLLDPKAAKIIQEVGVDVVGLVDFTDHIFAGDTELTFPEFMDLILQLRGSNGATVRDMVDMRKFLSNNLIDAVERIEKVVRQTDIVMRRATLPSCKSWEYEVQTSEGIASVGIARGPSLRLVESVAHPLTEDACLSEQDEKAVDGVKEVREG